MTPEVISSEPLPPVPMSPTPATTSREQQQQQHLAVAATVLQQAVDLVRARLTDDAQLTVSAKFLPGSTIGAPAGKHLRHARDHFEALLDCTTAAAPPYVLSYDARKRDTAMEAGLAHAAEALEGTLAKLRDVVPRASLDARLVLNAVTPFQQKVDSTFGRELWFCSLHAVHHWAMIRVICGELGVQLDDSFGFAPSTLVHQGSDAPLGKAKI